MLRQLTFSLPLLALTLAAPAPLEKKQDGVTVINNCYDSGQVALTFDGQYLALILIF